MGSANRLLLPARPAGGARLDRGPWVTLVLVNRGHPLTAECIHAAMLSARCINFKSLLPMCASSPVPCKPSASSVRGPVKVDEGRRAQPFARHPRHSLCPQGTSNGTSTPRRRQRRYVTAARAGWCAAERVGGESAGRLLAVPQRRAADPSAQRPGAVAEPLTLDEQALHEVHL
jgi:hypothetical protein